LLPALSLASGIIKSSCLFRGRRSFLRNWEYALLLMLPAFLHIC
jgi:hypothetical protein